MTVDALIVLGCRVRDDGSLSSALGRRVARAAELFEQGTAPLVLMSGGQAWNGFVEADAMRAHWLSCGLPEGAVLTECASLTTRGNAHESALIARERRWQRVAVVTCDFHLPRAVRHFRATGLEVVGYAACVERPYRERVRLSLREFGARLLEPWGPLSRSGSR